MTKTTFKIPAFISSYLSSLKTKERKDEAVDRYKSWYKHDYTQLLLKSLEKELDELIKDDEKADCISEFQLSCALIENKAKRQFIRKLLNTMKHEA